MTWEPSSVASRLRRLVRRQRAPDPPRSQDTTGTARLEQESSAQRSPIDRKILQDPSSLLDAHARDAVPPGLTPSTRLPPVGGGSSTRLRAREMEPDSPARAQSRFAGTLSHVSHVAAGGEWSTFGRKRERRVPNVADLSGRTSPPNSPMRTSCSPSPTGDSRHLSADSIASTFTLSRLTHRFRPSGNTHERRSSPSPKSPDTRFGSKPPSPANTMSSKRHPRTPRGPSSYTVLTTSSFTHSTTPVNRERTLDSPHTFGRPTSPDNPGDSPVAYTSPPPPLPPLDHPELTAALSSRSKSMSTFRADRSTDPPREGDLLRSLSLTLERPARRRPSVASATMAAPDAPDGRRRARTVSGGARPRRTSAEWSSYQASAGVNAHANRAWPAEVSRAMLRLSLAAPSPDAAPGSRKARTRGHSPDPVRRRDRTVMSPSSFLPFPPSRQDSRPSFRASATPPGQPISASSTPPRTLTQPHPDGRRSHSLHFHPGNSRGAERPARPTMAEVKRSSSAVEARSGRNKQPGGATDASVGLADPAPTTSEAPQVALLLHPFSAPTPSRLLLSGRVSPTNTPMSSSIRGEPSTPTPVPRQSSEKSRGKRKAEDNPDITPPEQKKEGQRATFLLPSESRSQRVSNASHAPSSYHRKRARLSTSSPFATPAQSRPSSVHETPRSTGRGPHFASLSSSTGARIASSRTPSRATSTRSRQPPTPSTVRKHERHQSMSQVSIPISAFISPHAPSISRSTKFHMRDPHKPPRKPSDTPWALRFGTEDEPGSPIQAWCFFLGFLLFPIWWVAGFFLRIPTTRIAGDVDAEKCVTIDDPQIEYDARIWRFRCRVMTLVSLFTYIPFIALVAVFAPR